MFDRFKRHKPDEVVKARLLNKLRNSTNTEVLRWADNVLTGTGLSVRDIQKSLNQNNPDQALVYVQEMRNGALSLLAVAKIIEERVTV